MSDSLQTKMAKGALWMVLFKLAERSLGLLSTLILARLLAPADFGVVAMALSFVFMAELLTAFGFDIAIIQDQRATREHYNSAWTCNVLLGLVITLLMILMAAPIADFYRKPELFWVVCALAFGPLLVGCENIGVVAFRKELDFRREFRFQLSRKLLGVAVVVPLAFLLRNYWALVIGTLFSKLGGTVISYLMHPFRPRFGFSKVRQLLVFSRWLLVNNVICFLKERSTDFFIGRLLGPASLGSYNVAYELASLPTTEISAPINRALLPGFARMTTPAEVSTAYGNAVGVLAALALPSAAGIMALAPFLVPVILGPKWLAAIPLMEILALNGALILFHSSMAAVLLGRGHSARTTFANGVFVAILLGAVSYVSLRQADSGAVGIAYATLATALLSTPIYLHQMQHCLGVAAGVFVKAIARPLLSAAAMAFIIRWALPVVQPDMGFASTAGWLGLGIVLGASSYVAVLLVLWHAMGRPAGAEQLVFERVRFLFAARFGPAAR